VVRSHGLYHDVQTGRGVVRCTARGKLKLDRRQTGGIAVGDRVAVEPGPGQDEGVIVELKPRDRVLLRRGILRGQPDQIILANATRLLAVFSVAQPEPRLGMLDRFLVLASAHELEAAVCVNKIDLDPTGALREPFRLYERIGYPLLCTSSRSGEGVADLAGLLAGRITVLAGPSGVGKTSLINRIAGTSLATAEVSEATGKGRHTTRGATLISVGDGYVADTAGIRALALAGVDRDELDLHFPEFEPYLGKCRFTDCAHDSEPGCAVRAAVERGAVDERRLASYRRLRARFDED
jgi:ribosome biogenesis GTPase